MVFWNKLPANQLVFFQKMYFEKKKKLPFCEYDKKHYQYHFYSEKKALEKCGVSVVTSYIDQYGLSYLNLSYCYVESVDKSPLIVKKKGHYCFFF